MTKRLEKTHVTKLEVAQRQIDSAIRMFLHNEDSLAIYTILAAAYQILRDLKKKQGRSELADFHSLFIFGLGASYATEPEYKLINDLELAPDLVRLAKNIGDLIKDGTISSPKDLNMTVSNEGAYWRKFNKVGSFLKHADADPESTLSIDQLDSQSLLFYVVSSYRDLKEDLTPEMWVFIAHEFAQQPGLGVPGWSVAMNEEFINLSPAQRRRKCLYYLRLMKKSK